MKYSDQQRIEKIRETTEKLLTYVQRGQITPEKVCNEETIQWTVTTPLTTLGSMSTTCRTILRNHIQKSRGLKLPA